MAGRIQGITVEIGGDITKLQTAVRLGAVWRDLTDFFFVLGTMQNVENVLE